MHKSSSHPSSASSRTERVTTPLVQPKATAAHRGKNQRRRPSRVPSSTIRQERMTAMAAA